MSIDVAASRHPGSGCAIAALAPDLARHVPVSRMAFDEGQAMTARIATALPAPVVTNAEQSDAILARGRVEAMRLSGSDTAKQ